MAARLLLLLVVWFHAQVGFASHIQGRDAAAASNAPTSSNGVSSSAMQNLQHELGFNGLILLSNSPNFLNFTQAWAMNYNATPQVALVPHTSNDVAVAIKWVNAFNLDFAIRSGGAAASQSHQVIISLSLLNTVDYIPSQGVIHLGPGNVWGDVYDAMADLDVTALGGRLPLIGVGGIVDAEVVLADGSIVWASENPDLLYAVRGAGFTIGAVTEYVVKAYPKPTQIYSGFVLFTMENFEAIAANVANTTAHNTDPDVAILMGVVLSGGVQTILVFPIVLGTEAFAKEALSWIWALPDPILDTTTNVSWETLQSLQLDFVSHPLPTDDYQQHSIVVRSMTTSILQAAVDWQTPLLSDPRWAGLQILIEPFIPNSFASHFTTGPWPHSYPTMHVIQLFIQESNAATSDFTENFNQLVTGAGLVEAAAGSNNVLQRYPNYYLQGTPANQFYGSNLAKLEAVKGEFDPHNKFNKGIAITPTTRSRA
ncbi:hypothetical protein BDP27DRAFT_1413630 [Rhodocollybia butyracea]|uniref:FAD-binding PCMH-type domain-containing protein n=1 Tax=Rhodocollybia butyracea TaxID=206335 RepID=A0A9P5QA80_9AGAR|nr:hypothetical protein BDP27DRAFT_1413630 [Rhodocollybia butyracea]